MAGIELQSSRTNTVAGNEVYKNEFGLSLYSSEKTAVTGNNFSRNLEGLHLVNSTTNVIRENVIEANDLGGVYWDRNPQAMLSGATGFSETGTA